MEEITQSQFHKLQAMVESGIVEKMTGRIEIRRSSENPENILYKNSRGKWLQRYNGICFAHKSLIKALATFENNLKKGK